MKNLLSIVVIPLLSEEEDLPNGISRIDICFVFGIFEADQRLLVSFAFSVYKLLQYVCFASSNNLVTLFLSNLFFR